MGSWKIGAVMIISPAPVIDITKTITREGYAWAKCIECNTRFLRWKDLDAISSRSVCEGCSGYFKNFICRDGPPGTTGLDGDPDMFGYILYMLDHLDIGKGFCNDS